jgi:3-hydroxyisobutyrate dehydrogenase-like beta-hydroxyacid dehydrogenase
MSTIKRVGIIGLGEMGNPMARHINSKGFEAIGYDVSPGAVAKAKADGIRVADSLQALALESDLAIIVVGFDNEVEAVLFDADGLVANMRPGSIIGIGSTVTPGTAEEFAATIAGTQIGLIDMPICRGGQAAIDGKLLVMGGGDAALFDACRPVMATFADAIYNFGKVGAGQVGKMINNLILWGCTSVDHEAFQLATALGVDPEALRPALLQSSAANHALEPAVWDRPMPWAEKDMMLVLKEADRAKVSLPLSGTIKEVIKGIKIATGRRVPVEAKK